jgi:glucokinase
MKKYIGVDLGGTQVRAALISQDGELLQMVSNPSLAQEDAQTIVNNLISTIHQLDIDEEVSGIGLGVPGPVDTIHGKMVMATNIPALSGYHLVKAIEDEFKLPTYMDNDANVAGLAEAIVGVGKDKPIVYYVTHSTGIGGALIVNGEVVSGRNGYAGEVGNIIIDRNRKRQPQLNVGAIENEASGPSITRRAKEVVSSEISNTKELFDLARKNDPKAVKLVDEIAYDMAMLFSAIAHVVDPTMFIIGGGVTKSKDVYFDLVKKYYKELVHTNMQDTEFAFASLKEPGLIGAAMLPKSKGN